MVTIDGIDNSAWYIDEQTDGTINFRHNTGPTVTVQSDGTVEIGDGDLTDGTSLIFDQTNGWVPLSILEANQYTVTGGNGVKNGGTASIGGSLSLDVEPADFAGGGLSDDGADNLQANLGNALALDGADNIAVSSNAIGTNEIDEGILPNWTGTHTWDTNTGANLSIDETGLSYSTSNAETLSVQNTGTGSVTLQEDGTPVVKETRSLTGGNAIDAIGDLSSDRTIAVSSNGIGTNEIDEGILPNWTGTHTWNTNTGADLSIDETGLSYSTSNAETLSVQNTGTGSVTIQEDGTPVVKETRSLTGGNAIDAIGDLSADRTVAVSAGGIGTNELDTSILPTWTGSHTWDTNTGANLSVDETGLSYSTSNAETLDIQNTGTGSVTVQEDGTPVVKETRSLTGGNAIDAIGDLSADRTIAVSADSIGNNELASARASDTSTQSGDATNGVVTFTIPHSLGVTPSVAHVQPESADASGDFYVSNKTSTDIDITYINAPPDGTDNLTWGVITVE